MFCDLYKVRIREAEESSTANSRPAADGATPRKLSGTRDRFYQDDLERGAVWRPPKGKLGIRITVSGTLSGTVTDGE